LRKYDVEINKVTVLSTDLSSDPKDPDRKNNIDPNSTALVGNGISGGGNGGGEVGGFDYSQIIKPF
jgi:hypothetical protein